MNAPVPPSKQSAEKDALPRTTGLAGDTAVFPRANEADICLLLEGTFPYVSGGVSSWVNQIIRAFPEIRFAIVFIGSRAEDYGPMKYWLPDNVVHLEVHYLYDFASPEKNPRPRHGHAEAFARADRLHDSFVGARDGEAGANEKTMAAFCATSSSAMAAASAQAASQRASGASGRRCFSMRASAQCRLTAVGRVAPSTAMASASRVSEASKSSAMARP